MAKEGVVSTLTILFGQHGELLSALTPLSALSLLVFSLLYTPCIAAVASIRRELGARWRLASFSINAAIAWVAAFIVHLIGMLI